MAAISITDVSGTWGGQITRQALIALAVFLVLVTIFLAFYFERAMAVAALVALVHDVVVTMGVYSLVGFEVTPATAIGLLTILGFSLYDTVVVFDKVKENTRGLLGLTRRTYAEAANLALNQTLMRSINTSLIAVLPVVGLMVVGVGLLGVGTLADLALVQIVGILAGAASSVLLATPILVDLKQRDPRIREQARRVAARRARDGRGRGRRARRSGADDPTSTDDDALAGELAPRARHGRRGRGAVPHGSGPPARPGASGPPARTPGRPGSGAGDRRLGRLGADPTTTTATRSPGCPPWSAPSPTSPCRASCSATSPRCWPTARPSPPSRSRSRRWWGRPTSWSGWRRGGSCSVPPRR